MNLARSMNNNVVYEVLHCDVTVFVHVTISSCIHKTCFLYFHNIYGAVTKGKMDSKFKAIRAGHRGALTKLLSKFEDMKLNSDVGVDEVRMLQDAVSQKQQILVDLNIKIVETISEENIEDEITDTDEYMYNLESKLRQINKLAYSLQSGNKTQHTQESASSCLNPNAENFAPVTGQSSFTETNQQSFNSNIHSTLPQVQHQSNDNFAAQRLSFTSNISNNNHRLPKLDLPYFNGDILHWQTFWDSFESTIHFNCTLTPIQKFSYLKAQLEGSAAQTIAGFSLTNANYDTAVTLLRERFGQPHKIIHAYMKALMELPSPTNELHSLRNYGDRLESYVRGLESLGQTQDMYGALLVPVINSKLPAEIRRNIAREHGSDNINLSNLRKVLVKEISILEAGQISENYDEFRSTATFLTGARARPQRMSSCPSPIKKSKDLKNRTCIFCSNVHSPVECTNVTDVNNS